ncbi:arsenic transporter [Paraburkholderia sp. BR10882]|uniref:arsenic transporter n=1 Tax=unclassified Paraburkholderia TaxID=2615204 RepID=UPI0034CE4002
MNPAVFSWTIAAVATAGVILRPLRWPEAIWAVGGALLLTLSGLLPLSAALQAIGKGTDVYLFLGGMMLLSEVARQEGLFDWIAALAVQHARGSPLRLLVLVYVAGVVTTTFLSNDATAVVMTPAVYAAAKEAKAEPLPLLLSCAFVANAASFVLPISNPANLVLYGNHTPPLGAWLSRFALASVLSLFATFALLWWTQRRALQGTLANDKPESGLGAGGRLTLCGLALTSVALLAASLRGLQLGAPTAVLGSLTTGVVLWRERASPWPLLKRISWSVLPLVAGLFVMVASLDHTGVIDALAGLLKHATSANETLTGLGAGAAAAFVSNVVNNLPAGLVASAATIKAQSPQPVIDALLIGVDLGPNLSVTGSLATILWLAALRREGESITFGRFLSVGAVVMPPALICALAARLLAGS